MTWSNSRSVLMFDALESNALALLLAMAARGRRAVRLAGRKWPRRGARGRMSAPRRSASRSRLRVFAF